MKNVKAERDFKILSHKVCDDVYEGQVLLSLKIEPIRKTDVFDVDMKYSLELHFDKDCEEYGYAIMHEYNEFDSSTFEYTLKESEEEMIKEYVEKEKLKFQFRIFNI